MTFGGRGRLRDRGQLDWLSPRRGPVDSEWYRIGPPGTERVQQGNVGQNLSDRSRRPDWVGSGPPAPALKGRLYPRNRMLGRAAFGSQLTNWAGRKVGVRIGVVLGERALLH